MEENNEKRVELSLLFFPEKGSNSFSQNDCSGLPDHMEMLPIICTTTTMRFHMS
jgi:hypothetical protein